jgi:hypothetical protein
MSVLLFFLPGGSRKLKLKNSTDLSHSCSLPLLNHSCGRHCLRAGLAKLLVVKKPPGFSTPTRLYVTIRRILRIARVVFRPIKWSLGPVLCLLLLRAADPWRMEEPL